MIRAVTLAGLVITLNAASCATVLRARQNLHSAPTFDCLRTALATSPDVVETSREFRDTGDPSEGFSVVLRDSTAAKRQRLATMHRELPNRAGHVDLIFLWPGLRRPPAPEERASAALAARLLTHVRATCAPADTGLAQCDRLDGKWKPCAPAG